MISEFIRILNAYYLCLPVISISLSLLLGKLKFNNGIIMLTAGNNIIL